MRRHEESPRRLNWALTVEKPNSDAKNDRKKADSPRKTIGRVEDVSLRLAQTKKGWRLSATLLKLTSAQVLLSDLPGKVSFPEGPESSDAP